MRKLKILWTLILAVLAFAGCDQNEENLVYSGDQDGYESEWRTAIFKEGGSTTGGNARVFLYFEAYGKATGVNFERISIRPSAVHLGVCGETQEITLLPQSSLETIDLLHPAAMRMQLKTTGDTPICRMRFDLEGGDSVLAMDGRLNSGEQVSIQTAMGGGLTLYSKDFNGFPIKENRALCASVVIPMADYEFQNAIMALPRNDQGVYFYKENSSTAESAFGKPFNSEFVLVQDSECRGQLDPETDVILGSGAPQGSGEDGDSEIADGDQEILPDGDGENSENVNTSTLTFLPSSQEFKDTMIDCCLQRVPVTLLVEGYGAMTIQSISSDTNTFIVQHDLTLPVTMGSGEGTSMAELHVQFCPTTAGPFNGKVNVVTDRGTFSMDVSGKGTEVVQLKDVLVQRSHFVTDALFVVGCSATLAEEKARLIQNVNGMLDTLHQGINLHMAVISSDVSLGGAFLGEPAALHRYGSLGLSKEDLKAKLAERINAVAACDKTNDQGIEAAKLALTGEINKDIPFLRQDSQLMVYFLSDRDDQGTTELSSYVDSFVSVLGQNHVQPVAIVGDKDTGCTSATDGTSEAGNRYIALAEAMRQGDPKFYSICSTDYTWALGDMSTMFLPIYIFCLTTRAVESSIAVTVDGVASDASKWEYDDQIGCIQFKNDYNPVPESVVEISYTVACDATLPSSSPLAAVPNPLEFGKTQVNTLNNPETACTSDNDCPWGQTCHPDDQRCWKDMKVSLYNWSSEPVWLQAIDLIARTSEGDTSCEEFKILDAEKIANRSCMNDTDCESGMMCLPLGMQRFCQLERGAGNAASVTLSFRPKNVGAEQCTLRLHSSLEETPYFYFPITGQGKAPNKKPVARISLSSHGVPIETPIEIPFTEAPVRQCFFGNTSYDEDGSLESFSWSTILPQDSSARLTYSGILRENVCVDFDKPGDYTVALKVVDDEGAESDEFRVTVKLREVTLGVTLTFSDCNGGTLLATNMVDMDLILQAPSGSNCSDENLNSSNICLFPQGEGSVLMTAFSNGAGSGGAFTGTKETMRLFYPQDGVYTLSVTYQDCCEEWLDIFAQPFCASECNGNSITLDFYDPTVTPSAPIQTLPPISTTLDCGQTKTWKLVLNGINWSIQQ